MNLLLIELFVCPTYGISTYISFFFSSIVIVVVVVVVVVVGGAVVSNACFKYLLGSIQI
jgi:hypothetical protein